MYLSSPDFGSDGSGATVVPWSNGPVGEGALHTTSSVPRTSSRLLTAYHRPPRWKTLSVCDTPPSAGISTFAFVGSDCQDRPSQYRQRLLCSRSVTWVRATRSEYPKMPLWSGRAVP